MRRGLPILAALVVATASHAAAQTVSVGGRAGTLGLGPDVSVSLNDRFILRGGASLLPLAFDLTPAFRLADDLSARLALPKAFYTLGAAWERGILRFGAGLLYKRDDPRLVIELGDGASVKIGNGRYTALQITELTATLRSNPWASYMLVGLGEHNATGLDIFVDLGVAFLNEPELVLAARGESGLLRSRLFRDDLSAEQFRVRRDLGDLVDYWPIVSFGIRYGFADNE